MRSLLQNQGCTIDCSPQGPAWRAVKDEGTKEIVWSYSVQWEPSDIAWASRWDTYLKMEDVEIHWFSIINSLVTVIFLSGS